MMYFDAAAMGLRKPFVAIGTFNRATHSVCGRSGVKDYGAVGSVAGYYPGIKRSTAPRGIARGGVVECHMHFPTDGSEGVLESDIYVQMLTDNARPGVKVAVIRMFPDRQMEFDIRMP